MNLTRRDVVGPVLRAMGWERLMSALLRHVEAGHVTVLEARCLASLAREAPPSRPIIEIGTLFGVSTRALFASKPKQTPLISVDNYSWNPLLLSPAAHRRHARRQWTEVPEAFGVEFVDMDREEYYADYTGPAPFLVFLDAIHTYEATRKDLLWATRHKVDLICSHDYDEDQWPGVVRAVREVGDVHFRIGNLAVQAFTDEGHEALKAAATRL